MTPFLPTLQALIAPERYTAVEHLWLVLWAHPGALAAEQILRHLVTGLAEEETRLARLDAQDLCEDLAHWRETGFAVLRAMEQLPPDLQTQVQRSAKHKTAHPLTRHGLTANSLYAAFWNRHEEETSAAAFRRLQCVSLRLQQHLIEAHGIAFADYSNWFANQTGDKATASLDFFAHQHGLGLSNLGWALRTLSWQRHTPLLQAIDRCTAPHADLTDILTAWMRLSEDQTTWASQDAHTQQERQRVADSLRLIADKALQSTQRVTRKRTKGARQRQTGRGVESGFISDLTRQRHDHPPEDLPEFEDWVPTEEVLWPEPTEEADEGIEAPRPSGLHLVHPHELAGRVARLQAQRHYLAMLHHSFGWDSAALTDAETALLSRWYDELRAHSHDSLTPTAWAQAAVLVSWLLGRSIEEVLRLQVLSAEEATYDSSADVAIVETDPSSHVYAWRIALRQPIHRHYNYDHRLDRVRFLLIPDQTGLAAVLMRWHHPSAGPRATRLWPAKQEHTHTAHAQAVLAASETHSGAHNRLSLTMIKRHLRLTLLNLVPDRTIAWMLAGTPQDAVSPRMFYAAHTPEELIFWMQKAQARLLPGSAIDPAPTVRPPATPYLDGQMRSYAGAKFLPECASLRALCVTARLLAQHAPPVAYLSPNDTAPPSANSIWMQVQTWRQWHDHVVRWAWLVQALLTGIRALKDPSTLYHQWLKHPRQRWLSIEDKLSKDHDESRFTWLSPLLNEAFDTLTVVQLLYQERWADASGSRSKMPIGFVVFDEHTTPKALRPAHLSQWLEQQQRQWPVNFNRALLRRVWSELGMSNDGLDALLGHGATSDRLHDRHSLFDPARFTETLSQGLPHIARAFQLGRLHNRHRLSRHHPRYEKHRQQALDALANRSKVPAVAVPRDTSPFERWCQLIAQTQCLQDAPSVSALHDLHPWFELLQQHTHLEYACYLLRQPNALEPLPTHEKGHAESVAAVEVQRHAQALEDALVEAVRQGQLGRSIAAQGFGVAYRISKALHPERPTMRLAITPPARVSPYSISRLYSAAQTDAVRQAALAHLRPSPQPPVTDADWQRHHAILACFLNVTSHPARWSACMQALQQPHSDVDVIFAQRYEYVLKRWDERRRVLHGFVEVLSRQVPLLHVSNDTSTAHDPIAAERQDAKRLFRSQRIKGMPTQLGGWTQGLAWWSYLHLPALIAEHLAGRLDDQSATGPWLAQFPDAVWAVDKALHLPASAPPSVDAHISLDGLPCPMDVPPLGWSETLPHAATPAGAWVKAQLAWHVGAEERQRDGLQATLLQLPAAAPAPWREQVRALVRAIQAREGLVDPSQPLAVAWVDRQVIDHDTYYAVLAHLERQMLHRRASQRQRHLRLLIVLAFRFGMRRREILGLRAMDVALEGEGRIHIRPYAGHRLKTRFSARSLPIAPLLPAHERQWLCEACQARAASDTLIPSSEWDTLTREAIGVLRQLGGDDTLKLHHLRHSFASLLTLKVILARHPEWVVKLGSPTAWAQEWAQSPALVGTLLKPWDASADFLVVPRLLGHSSYQVSLTHYVHTLDVAAALYLEHELSPRVMANRDLVHLVRRRYATGLALRTGAACGPTGWTAAPAVQHPLSAKAAFEDTLMQCLHAEQAGEPIKIVGVTRKMIEDWFAPRHAAALRDQLWQACERTAMADLVFLRRVTARYWKDEPPLFWFNAGGEDAHTVLDDALALCRLWLKLGFAADQIVVWRYAQASVRTHKTVWKPVWSALGTACSSASISGRSDSPKSLGLSLCSSHGARVKRSALLGFWCRVMSAESSC